MPGVRFSAVVAVIAATSAITGIAHAARLAKIDPSVYSFSGGPDGTALLDFSIGKDEVFSRNPDRPQVARNITMACVSGSTPPTGIPAGQAIVLRIPGHARIIGNRRFAYSGPATVSPIGPSGTTAPTTVEFAFAFTGRARSRNVLFPTGVKGSFTSSACRAPVAFAFPFL